MAERVTLQDNNTSEVIYPKTLVNAVYDSAGNTVDQITLLKDNTTAFSPTGDYQPATKKYVDDNSGVGVVVSATQPTSLHTGDFWYEEG